MSRFVRPALLIALLLSLAASTLPPLTRAAPAAQTGPLNPELFGMVVRDPWYDFGTDPNNPGKPNELMMERTGQVLAEAGVRWVRVEFIVRSGAGTVEEQIARNDYFINVVAPRYGLKVMGLLGFALVDIDPRDKVNGFVAKPPSSDPTNPYGGGVNSWMRSWLDRALYIAQRYEGRVAAYEILNEQNRLPPVPPIGTHEGYRGGEGIDPVLTARLHTKFYRCFKQNQCSNTTSTPASRSPVTIIIGGVHPRGSDLLVSDRALATNPPISDREYIIQLYKSEPFVSYFATAGAFPVDGLAYHPYPAEIALSLAAVDAEVLSISKRLDDLRGRLRTTLQTVSPAAAEVPFWITEVGYNAGYLKQNSAGQAAFLRGVYTAMGARSDVRTVFWFKYEDFPPASGVNAQQWGIVRIPFTDSSSCPGGACYAPNGEPSARRLSFFVYRELAGLPVEHVALPLMRR
jgi:hypothetical protein